MKKTNLIAGFLGAFVMAMADLFSKDPSIIKAGNLLSNNLQIESVGGCNFLVIFLIFLLGIIICWIYEPKTKVDGFIRGMSVFAILSLSPPVEIKKSQTPIDNPESSTSLKNLKKIKNLTEFEENPYSLVSNLTYNNSKLFHFQTNFQPNATIKYNEWISECKPTVSFISFFTNSVKICHMTIKGQDGRLRFLRIKEGAEIEILEEYDTPLRSYKYLKVRFQSGKTLKTGWIYSGKEPDGYINVILNDNYNDSKSVTL